MTLLYELEKKSIILVRVSKKRVSESRGSLNIDISNHFSFL